MTFQVSRWGRVLLCRVDLLQEQPDITSVSFLRRQKYASQGAWCRLEKSNAHFRYRSQHLTFGKSKKETDYTYCI